MMMIDPYLAEREMKLSTEGALASAELARLAKGHGEPRRRQLASAFQGLKDSWMRQRLTHLEEAPRRAEAKRRQR